MSAVPPEDREFIQMPTEVMFGMGWSRFLPPASVMVFAAIGTFDTPTDEQMARFMTVTNDQSGLAASAWDEPREWTAEELDEHHAEYPPGPGEPTSLDEVNAQERSEHEARIAKFDRYASTLGVPPVRTMADMITFMVACRLLVTTTNDEGQLCYEINPTPPLPHEVLPLDTEERDAEDDMRWDWIHEPTAQKIISLFTPDAPERPTSKRTSLQRLARELDSDTETARAGLVSLLQSSEFTATRAPETLTEFQVFDIHVDWEIFSANRITIVRGDDRETDE
jgi:hypothetical protein